MYRPSKLLFLIIIIICIFNNIVKCYLTEKKLFSLIVFINKTYKYPLNILFKVYCNYLYKIKYNNTTSANYYCYIFIKYIFINNNIYYINNNIK